MTDLNPMERAEEHLGMAEYLLKRESDQWSDSMCTEADRSRELAQVHATLAAAYMNQVER